MIDGAAFSTQLHSDGVGERALYARRQKCLHATEHTAMLEHFGVRHGFDIELPRQVSRCSLDREAFFRRIGWVVF